MLIVSDPQLAFAKIAQRFNSPVLPWQGGVHPSAVISEKATLGHNVSIGPNSVVHHEARIGEGTSIGAGCVVGEGSTIGSNCIIHPNVTLYHRISIGNYVTIHSGAVVGADGFGFANEGGQWVKIPQLGSLNIGDYVQIGANTTIDRGALNDTIIEQGVILDNQIQIAHNCVIGAYTAIAGCVGIAGSAKIGRHCLIGGAACINGHVEITDQVIITGLTMVTKSIKKPGVYSSGTIAQSNSEWHRNAIRFQQLDHIAKRVRKLEKEK